jgi:lysophospholipase L1-like esterase
VRHEAYGGWTWQRFLTHYEPGSAKTMHLDRSPFVFASSDGRPALDVARYCRDQLGGKVPDVVVFEMGMNDVFCLRPDQPEAMRREMGAIAEHAARLLAAFHEAAPAAKLGILMPPQFSTSPAIYPVMYAAEFSRWRIRQLNHAWLETLHDRFRATADHATGANATGENAITLIPTYVSFDALDGYAANDPGHPNAIGARQYAASVHAWMKHVICPRVQLATDHARQRAGQ